MKHHTKSKAPVTDYSNLRIQVDPLRLASVATFRATHDIRYYLAGVLVEKAPQGGVFIVASDGHTMGVGYDEFGSIEGHDRAILKVSKDLLAACRKRHKGNPKVMAKGQRLFLADGLDGFDAEATESEFFVQAGKAVIDTGYPDWKRVMPDPATLTREIGEAHQAAYLARFHDAMKILPRCSKQPGVKLWQAEKRGVVVAQPENDTHLLMLVMPMHESATDGDSVHQMVSGPFGEAKRQHAATLATAVNLMQQTAANEPTNSEAAA